jgi:hypothetical protein
MRELTKSTLSAGLAMSLFGMQTMMNVFRRPPASGPNPAQEGMDAVTQAMVDQTGATLREAFQAGDRAQRRLVDLSFQIMTLGLMRPGRGMSTMSGMTQQATGMMSRMMGGMGGARDPDCGCSGSAPRSPGASSAPMSSQPWPAAPMGQGWGPMPNQS